MIPDDYYISESSFIKILDGAEFLADGTDDHFQCDFCSKGIAYTSVPRVAMYWSDRVLSTTTPKARRINRERKLSPMASYCPECIESYPMNLLLFPCEGFGELRSFVTVTDDRHMTDPEVTDFSEHDDGIPWDPKEFSEEITDVPFEMNDMLAGGEGMLWAPENMVTFFLSVADGVDIRELIKYDGSYDPRLLGQARRKYEEFQRSMRQHGHERGAFRKRLKDRRKRDE